MTDEQYKRAVEIKREINKLESFMFWCSGKREGGRRYPTALIAIKRKWLGGVKSEEYDLPDRLQEQIIQCIENELDILNTELKEL
jgi:hypothetical protein